MILDEWLTYEQKVFVAMAAGGLWMIIGRRTATR